MWPLGMTGAKATAVAEEEIKKRELQSKGKDAELRDAKVKARAAERLRLMKEINDKTEQKERGLPIWGLKGDELNREVYRHITHS